MPVGPSWLHRMSRGLDPAEEIAGALGSRLGIDVQYPLRRIDRRRQRGRPRERRLADPPRFRAAAEPPPRAILVDDVLTTGGTLRSCAETLRAAGSTRVSAAVFAASPPPGRLG